MRTLRILLRSAPVALAGLVVISGCLSTRTESPAADRFDSLGMSLAGIRQSNLRTAYRFGLAIEEAADSIISHASDRTTKINAYLWKIYSVPVIRQIYSQSDPIVASVDALAFAMQCEQYFDTGIGSDRFGDHQLIAVNASVSVQDALIEGMRRNLSTANFDTLIALIDEWAKEHPLTNHTFSRASLTRELDHILAQQDQSLGSAIGRIANNVDDLSGRLALYGAQIPREARWQGEYLLAEYAMEERLTRLDTTIGVLTSSLASVEETLTEGEVAVDIAGLRSLHADLQAALELVRTERAIILAEVERQRLETITAMELIVENTVVRASSQAECFVDSLLWKLGILLALVLLGVALLVLLVRALWRGQKRAA